jgi:hypothetical protein
MAGIASRVLIVFIFLAGFCGFTTPAIAQYAATIGSGTITTFAGVSGQTLSKSTTDNQLPKNIPLATSSSLLNAVTTDSNGNVYIGVGSPGQGNSYVAVVYAGGPVPPLLKFRTPSPTPGYFYYIVGTVSPASGGDTIAGSGRCQGGPCGDGGSALAAALDGVAGLAVDGSGNLYISDPGDNAIRKVDASTGNISTFAGDLQHKHAGYSGENKTAAGSLLNYPAGISLDSSGNLYIAEFFNHLIRKVDTNGKISTVAGTDPPVASFSPGTVNTNGCSAAPCGDGGNATNAQLYFPSHVFVSGSSLFIADEGNYVIREIANGIINTVAGKMKTPCSAAPCGDGDSATSAELEGPAFAYVDSQNNLLIDDVATNSLRVVDSSGNIKTVVGKTAPVGSAGDTGDGGRADQALISAPNQFAFDQRGNLYIAEQGSNLIRKVTPVVLKSQTITFDPIPDHVYGDPAFNLDAVASSGLPVTYSVTGPARLNGSTLTITGVGTVSVVANQSGDDYYDAAPPVMQDFKVTPATLTVTAADISFTQGNPVPTSLQILPISGFVNGDMQSSIVTGTPVLTVVNSQGTVQPAGSTPPIGLYTIRMTRGTLNAGPNYIFDLVNGELRITGTKAQTITFAGLPNTVYGAAPFALTATASSGLPVTYTATGPIRIQQSSIKIIGAGTASITAMQLGDDTYAAAPPITRTFTIQPAVLTIKADDATRGYGATNPEFSYTAAGFVNADTNAILSGEPAFSTTATQNSPAGKYPITVTQGTLSAQNYSFQFVNGTLTISPASQTIKFPGITGVAFNLGTGQGAVNYPLTASASSHLPITYKAAGPVVINSGNTSFSVTGVGPASITAMQAGNSQYASASVTNSFVIARGTVTVAAQSVSRPQGAENPEQFPYQYPAGAPPANLYSGVPDLETTATDQSPAGAYPIVVSQGTLTSHVYNFQFLNSTLTVTPPSTYTLSVTPTAITIPRGQSRQVTVTLTPVNNYIGSVTISCDNLPAGVTCASSPAALTTVAASNTGQASPVQGTLTISAEQTVASADDTSGGKRNTWLAGFPGITGLLSCVFIAAFRKKLKQNALLLSVLLLFTFLASIGSIMACGGGARMGPVATGTTQINVTGNGTQSPGTGNTNQSISLAITIE